MTTETTEPEGFFFAPPAGDADDSLTLNIDGWEGPLDLLLALARNQKVDLREISILELVQQYLKYIADAQSLKLELAADYLVMAAWLTYLKSGSVAAERPGSRSVTGRTGAAPANAAGATECHARSGRSSACPGPDGPRRVSPRRARRFACGEKPALASGIL